MALDPYQLTTDVAKSKDSPVLDAKVDSGSNDLEAVNEKPRARFGHSDKSVGGRIAPVLPHLQDYDFGSDESGEDILGKQIELEAGNAIQYRTCSWQKVSQSLFHRLICLLFRTSPCWLVHVGESLARGLPLDIPTY
jgi:hypothetical protein